MAIGLRAAGAVLSSSHAVTATNPLVPSGTTTGDLSILGAGGKPFGITFTDPSGWTKIGEATNGTTASGTDTGSTKVAAWVRESAPVGAIGNMTIGGSPNTLDAVINTYTKAADTTWDVTSWTTGGDTANGANFSATGGAGIAVAAGDWVVAVCSVNGDVGTPSAIAIGGMSGATLGATSTRQSHAVTTGADNRLIVADCQVTDGSSSAAPTFTYTNASPGSGTVLWLRLREVPAPTVVLTRIVAQGARVPAFYEQIGDGGTEGAAVNTTNSGGAVSDAFVAVNVIAAAFTWDDTHPLSGVTHPMKVVPSGSGIAYGTWDLDGREWSYRTYVWLDQLPEVEISLGWVGVGTTRTAQLNILSSGKIVTRNRANATAGSTFSSVIPLGGVGPRRVARHSRHHHVDRVDGRRVLSPARHGHP